MKDQCPFCQQPCPEISFSEFSDAVKGYKCKNHCHTVQWIYFNDRVSYTYDFIYKNSSWQVFGYRTSTGDHWELKLESQKPLISLDYIPDNITPDNVDQKIPGLIIFS